MFDSLPLMLAQASQPAADEVPIRPNTPALVAPTEQTTGTATQGTAASAPLPNASQQTPPGPFGGMSGILLIMVVFAAMWWFMGSAQRKDKKKRAAMLAALKKGDKVQTIGGMIGSVIEVREHDVVLKVDDTSNTRIKFTRGAIQTVLEDKPVDVEQTP